MLLKVLLCFAIDKFTSNVLFSKECFTKFQFMSEKIGGAIGTEFDDDFVSLGKVLC